MVTGLTRVRPSRHVASRSCSLAPCASTGMLIPGGGALFSRRGTIAGTLTRGSGYPGPGRATCSEERPRMRVKQALAGSR